MMEEKRAYAPGEKPCTPEGSAAGETWHYRDKNGEKLEPVAYIYTRRDGTGRFCAEAENAVNESFGSREAAEGWVGVYLESAGYTVIPATTVAPAPTTIQDPRAPAYGATPVYFPTANICISAPNVEIGVTVPEVDQDSDGFVLTKPGSVMLVGGDIKFCEYAGNQPTICHLIDHATGDIFTIPAHISDQEVMALVQARRQYVRDNLRQGPGTPPVPDAAPDNDDSELVN